MNSEGHGPIYVNRTKWNGKVVDAAPFLIRAVFIIHKPLRVRSN